MSALPPIFVINREKDRVRKKEALKHYTSAKLAPTFFEAVDGHGNLKSLAPYADFLADSFWGQPDIKPGAFACFMSHRNVWQHIVDEDLDGAIIAEDDTIPERDLAKKWQHNDTEIEQSDLVFLNNRMSTWASQNFQDVDSAITARLSADQGEQEFRAPGADGYYLSQSGAKTLLKASLEEGVFCGVDWFMLACAWDSSQAKHGAIKAITELKKIWKHRGQRERLINAAILKEPWFSIDKSQSSSINHSERATISVFRSQLLG